MVKRTILTVIILAILAVVAATFSAVFITDEKITKHEIESLAKDYYENYLYETISNANKEKPLSEILKEYETSGFSDISLRQLIIFNDVDGKNLTNFCDENKTTLRFYPKSPFGKTDYDIKYNYSCTFE